MKAIHSLLLTSTAAVLAACGPANSQAPGGAGMPPPEVDVVTVGAGSVTLTEDLPGRVQAIRSAQIRARVEGVVEKRLFTEGSDVKAGSSLFLIDARTYQAAADSAAADLALAKLTVERYQPLLAVKAVSQQEYDTALAKQKQAAAALAKAALDLENATVPAPISGRIGRALVTEGALVGKNEATQMALIEQLDPIYVDFTQSGSELLRLKRAFQSGKLQSSKEVKVSLLLEDGSAYGPQGRLTFTDLAMDPNTGAVTLRAEFPNPKHDLLPGMFVRVRFPQGNMANAISVPQRAVQTSAVGQQVLIVSAEGKVEPRPVKTGGMSGGDWIINDGLAGGEQVIVDGLQKARPGSQVKAMPWHPAEAKPAAVQKAN